jgi:SAM-dependent methyltransferase
MSSEPEPTSVAVGPSPLLVTATHPFLDDELAWLYDVFPFSDDIPAYLELAERSGGPVLEPACGTGRVLLPLAAEGHFVVGVDASPHMLARARRKVAVAPPEVAGRIRLVEADMQSIELGDTFGLAVIAARSFGHLLTPSAQLAALEAIRRHLEPGGLLALDLVNPSPAWLAEPPATPRLDLSQELPEEGLLVNRTVTIMDTDVATQVRVLRSEYEMVASDGSVAKRFVEWPWRWVHRFEIEHLLARTGFEVEEICGGYLGEPFTGEGRTMFVVARRI